MLAVSFVDLSGSWPSIATSTEEILSARDLEGVFVSGRLGWMTPREQPVNAGLFLSVREREFRSRESASTLTFGTRSSSSSSEMSAQSWSFLDGVTVVILQRRKVTKMY